MGLTTWRNAPDGKIVKRDVSIAKKYLNRNEIDSLERIVSMYLEYAEEQARRKVPTTMEDWARKLDALLQFNERDILDNSGKDERMYSAFLFENDIDDISVFDQFLIENFKVVCPAGGVISYEDEKVKCSVHEDGSESDEDESPGDEVPWL